MGRTKYALHEGSLSHRLSMLGIGDTMLVECPGHDIGVAQRTVLSAVSRLNQRPDTDPIHVTQEGGRGVMSRSLEVVTFIRVTRVQPNEEG